MNTIAKRSRHIWACAVLLDTTGLVAPALAQEARRPAEANDGLQEITVTARRSQETLTDVPLAITALTAQAMESRGVTDIFQVAQFTPGFRFQNQSVGRNDRGFKQYVIRGMVPNSALATRQSVTLFVDGAPVAGGNINGVTDIERVETIKGPQSAFFGRATFAGAINFITRAPSYDWGGSASVQYESYDTIDANASIEGGIIPDKLAFRLSGRYYDTAGAYKNDGWPGERLGARSTKSISLSVLAEPTDTLRIRLFGTHWNDSDGLPANALLGAESLNCTVPGNGAPVGYICGKLPTSPNAGRTWGNYIEPIAYDAVQNGSTLYGPNFVDHLGLERKATQLRLMVDWEIGDFTLSGIASYGKNKWGFLQTGFGVDTRDIPNPSFDPALRPIAYNYSLVLGNTQDADKYFEVRLSSPDNRRLKAMIGTNFYDGETHNLTAGYTNTGYSLFTPKTINSSKTYGVFGSVNWEFLDDFNISLEGRYQIDKLFQQTMAGANPQYSDTFRSFSPRAIVSYKPTPNSSIYASYSIGNRPGEFNTIFRTLNPVAQQQVLAGTGGVAEAVPEDKVKMGEIGYKGTLFDNRLRLLFAAYYGKWTNRHVPNLIPYYDALNPDGTPAPGEILRSVQLTNSNGRVELKGIELEAALLVAPGFTVEGTFSISDTKIENTGCTDCLALIGTLNPRGMTLPGYPKYAGTASATYEHQIDDDVRAFVRGDVIYTGRQYDTEANLTYTGAAALVNARFGVEWDSYRVELFARNLFDNDTATSLARGTQSIFNPDGTVGRTGNAITVSLPEPQTFGIRGSVKF